MPLPIRLFAASWLTCQALVLVAPVGAQNLVAHWNMNNPTAVSGVYGNSVGGAPAMVHDATTQAFATFDPNETRLEVNETIGTRTRFSASGASINSNTFSFSMIIDPTEFVGFKTIINKESRTDNNFADFVRVGWQVQHTGFGNLEFVVRGTQPQLGGGNDFFGNLFVFSTPDPQNNPSLTNMFPEGQNFDDPTLYHIAGGYNATTGDMFFYATRLNGVITQLYAGDRTTHLASRTPGAVQDNSPLSLGSRRAGPAIGGGGLNANDGTDFFDAGGGFDIGDLQLYDALLSVNDLLFLANNPGLTLDDMAGLAGDYNANGRVDAADYTVWRDGGSPDSSQAGYNLWANNFGASLPASAAAVPEPSSLIAALVAIAFAATTRRRRLE